VKFQIENLRLIKGNESQNFGAIYSGNDAKNNEKIILKRVSKSNLKGIESINREFSIQLNSKDFPEIIAFEEDDDNVMLLSKFKNGERLDIFWKTLKKKNRISTLKQIISGLEPIMELLEKEKIAHCDIKPSNIIVDKNDDDIKLSLIDFGMSSPFNFEGVRNLRFPLGYAAPELILNHLDLVNQKTDVFSIGVMIWRLFADKIPLSHPNPSIYTNIQLNLALPENDNISKELLNILNRASNKHLFSLPPNLMQKEEVKTKLRNALNERINFETLQNEILNLSERKRWFF
jgi:serine/threonine protein kinase